MVERQCCANAQHARRQTIEIMEIPKSVPQNRLEDIVCNNFSKLKCNGGKNDVEDYNWLKGVQVSKVFKKKTGIQRQK